MIRLALRAVWFHRRAYAGVVLGVALAGAVVVGGLWIGDGLRAALAARTAGMLGPVTHAVQLDGRWARDALADDLFRESGVPAAPVLALDAVVGGVQRVVLRGVDGRLGALGEGAIDALARPGEMVVNEELASRLGVTPGDTVVVRVERPSALARESALTASDDTVVAMRITLGAVLPRGWPADAHLRADAREPRNAFVDLAWLQRQVGLEGKTNQVWFAGPELSERTANQAMARVWTLADASLELARTREGEAELRSDRVMLEDPSVRAARSIGNPTGVLGWLADEIRHGSSSAPYAVVAAVEPGRQTAIGRALPDLASGEVALNQWLADDLGASVGDFVQLAYPVLGAARRVGHERQQLRVVAVLPMEGAVTDPGLMPRIEGIEGAESCRDWSPGLPVDLGSIRDEDEAYWSTWGGAPKAFVSLEDGQAWWATRYGGLTALRWADGELEARASSLLTAIDPRDFGLTVNPVADRLQAAANPANDFGGLFLGFGFVLVVSAFLLTSTLFSLVLESRLGELGLLLAVGLTRREVWRMVLTEGAVAALAGAALGAVGSLPVAAGLVWALGTLWQDATPGATIGLMISPMSVLIGLGGTASAGLLALGFGARKALARSPRDLLVPGAADVSASAPPPPWVGRGGKGLLLVALVVVLLVDGRDPQAALVFFAAGACALVGGLGWSAVRLGGEPPGLVPRSLIETARAATGRQRGRSMTVITLLALGTFTVVGVGAMGHEAPVDIRDRASGTGGFVLMGEATLPLQADLDGPQAQATYGLPPGLMRPGSVLPMRVRDGDDASCLNLGRAQTPRLLGVDPAALADREAFTFVDGVQGARTWDLLNARIEGGAVPAVGDEPTVRWGLHLGIGDELTYVDEAGEPMPVVIVGIIGSSVLQGSLIIGEHHFERRFPSSSGAHWFLADVPQPDLDRVTRTLGRLLGDAGVELSSTSEVLARFHHVEATYVRIFAALGGLGVIVGSLGVGILLLRSIAERRGELALLQVTGFSRRDIRRLLVVEWGALLSTGLLVGTVAALIAVTPALRSEDASVPLLDLFLLILGVSLCGGLGVYLGARVGLSRGVSDVLRRE